VLQQGTTIVSWLGAPPGALRTEKEGALGIIMERHEPNV
jgi:hypothetical protein